MVIDRIAVIGAGLMGKGIVHSFAASGYGVDVFGRRNNVEEEIKEYFNNEEKRNRITPEQKNAILTKVNVYDINCHAQKLADSGLVIETVKEDMDVKGEILNIISKHIKKDTIVASNTSGFSITGLAEFTDYPENFLGMHFFSPVPMMKLVEVVKGLKTDEAVLQSVCELIQNTGKIPVQVKDSPGFVLSRGLDLMLNEAVYMFSEGIAGSAEDIDNIFIHGMGMKVGPLRLADLVGIDILYAAVSHLYEGFKDNKYMPCSLLKQMVDEGKIGKKAGIGFYTY